MSEAIGTSAGDAVLDRIFRQNTSTPNYITVLLGRNNDPTDPHTGDLTVGEILPGYEQVTSQPKLPVTVLASSNSVNQHWQILLDADGVIGPANNNVIDEFNVVTAVSSTTNKKQLTVSYLSSADTRPRCSSYQFHRLSLTRVTPYHKFHRTLS